MTLLTDGPTTAEVLGRAQGEKLRSVVVVGYLEDGRIYTHASELDEARVVWLLEHVRCMLLSTADEIEAAKR